MVWGCRDLDVDARDTVASKRRLSGTSGTGRREMRSPVMNSQTVGTWCCDSVPLSQIHQLIQAKNSIGIFLSGHAL